MSLFSTLFGGLFSTSTDTTDNSPSVNPATGLPMLDGVLDVEGNTFGTNLHDSDHLVGSSLFDDNHFSSSSSWDDNSWSSTDDSWSSSGSSWDD